MATAEVRDLHPLDAAELHVDGTSFEFYKGANSFGNFDIGLLKADNKAARIHLNGASLSVGRLPNNTEVRNEGILMLTSWTGDSWLSKRTPIVALVVQGGTVIIERAFVEGLRLNGVEKLEVGSHEMRVLHDPFDFDWDPDSQDERNQLATEHEHYNEEYGPPIAVGVLGDIKTLLLLPDCTVEAAINGIRPTGGERPSNSSAGWVGPKPP